MPQPNPSPTRSENSSPTAFLDALQSRERRRDEAAAGAGLTRKQRDGAPNVITSDPSPGTSPTATADRPADAPASTTADSDPSRTGGDTSLLSVLLETRSAGANISACGGIDTVHLLTDHFQVSDRPALTVEDRTDMQTGDADVVPLFRPGADSASPVYGGKAYANTKLAQVTLYGIDALAVQCSLPKHLHGNNVEAVRTPDQLTLALSSLERYLQRMGIRTDLHQARITRLDTCRTVELSELVESYRPVLRSLDFPRMEDSHDTYNGVRMHRWKNRSRSLVAYDKGLEQGGEPSRTLRLEYRLTSSSAVQYHTDIQTTTELLGHMDDAESAYLDAAQKLFSADVDDYSDVTTEEGFRALLDAFEGQRGSWKKALLALCVHDRTAEEKDQMLRAVGEKLGRSTKHRFKALLEEMQGPASVYDQAATSEAQMYRELKDALAS